MNQLVLKIKGHLSYFWLDFHEFLIAYVIFLTLSVLVVYLLIKVWTKPSVFKIFAVNLLLFLFLLIHLFYGLELYYRYFFDQTDNILQIKTTQRWIDRHVRINAYSFRNDHFFKAKDAKELRLATVGDSYTYGYGIKNESNRFSNLLERQLNQDCSQTGGTAKVYNMARPGLNTTQELEVIRLFTKEHLVDGVILAYSLDDARSSRTGRHTDICYNRIFRYRNNPILNFILGKSFALEYLYVRAYSRVFAKDYTNACWSSSQESLYQDPEIWVRHLLDLKTIIDYTRKEHIGLAVLIFPIITDLGSNYPAAEIHQRLDNFLNSNNIPIVDLLNPYLSYKPQQLMISPRDFHANELGHQIAFDNLYEIIKNEPWAQCKSTMNK